MQESIIQKTKFGILWNAFEKFGVQGLGFVFNVILARILSPNDYGLFALLIVFVSFCHVFVESGFTRALIQKQDRSEIDFSTAFIFNIAVAVVAYIILFIASPFIADFYDKPELENLAKVLFLLVILYSLNIVQIAKFQIDVNFKKIALINLVALIISGVVGIALAMSGFGVWALVLQLLLKQCIVIAMSWYYSQWRPRAEFSKVSFDRLFGFGIKLSLVGFIAMILANIYNLFIAKIYDTHQLGLYHQSEVVPTAVFGAVTSAIATATFPLLSALQNDKSELVRIFKRLIKITSLLTIPVMVGLAVISENFILVFLTDKWIAAAPLLFWFCLCYIFTPISTVNLNILPAIGRSDLFLKIALIKLPLTLTMMAITFPISLKAIIMGQALLGFIAFFINTYLIKKYYNFGAFEQLTYIWRSFVASLIMAVVMFFTDKFIQSPLLSLIVCVIVGSITYIFSLWVLKEEELFIFIKKLKNKFGIEK
ncbi:MAG: lipopolysaccharide biosynthesis protein [Campylobacter sp.]|nr:lipopolysaccharide biosynthesis protein [Campylobacter sp.]MBQ9875628.1 lipopolysaccharide biosynthesis protein [Campylobacter sp.]